MNVGILGGVGSGLKCLILLPLSVLNHKVDLAEGARPSIYTFCFLPQQHLEATFALAKSTSLKLALIFI